MKSVIKYIVSLKWFWIAMVVNLMIILFKWFPSFAENIYFKGVFQAIRIVYDHTLGLLPFPMFYVLFLTVVFIFYKVITSSWNHIKKKNFFLATTVVVNTFSLIYILFYVLWGFNYYTPSLSSNLGFENRKMNVDQLYAETIAVSELVSQLREESIGDTSVVINKDHLPHNFESLLRHSQESILKEWDYPTYGRVRIRKLRPGGLLLRISTAGVYILFNGHSPWLMRWAMVME